MAGGRHPDAARGYECDVHDSKEEDCNADIPDAAIRFRVFLVHNLRHSLPRGRKLLAPMTPRREKVDDNDVVMVHVRIPRRFIERHEEIHLTVGIRIPEIRKFVILRLRPLEVLNAIPNLGQAFSVDWRLPDRLGQVQLFRPQRVAHVQRGILTRQRRERDVKVDPQQLAVRRPVDDHDAFRVEAHVRPELRNQEKGDEQRCRDRQRAAQQTRLHEILFVCGTSGCQFSVSNEQKNDQRTSR